VQTIFARLGIALNCTMSMRPKRAIPDIDVLHTTVEVANFNRQ
jgi:hypothetical protein